MRSTATLFAAAACLAAAPAAAKPLQTEQFKATAPFTIQPTRAYLLVRNAGTDLKLLRVPTAAEQAAYQAERAQALVKAKAKYAKQLKGYEADMAAYAREKSPEFRGPKPEMPVEPTDANLAFKAIESDNFVTVWGGRLFDGKAQFIAVPPGTYRVYGRMLTTGNGNLGVCMCMGTVQFDAAGGTITDLGEFHHSAVPGTSVKEPESWHGMTRGKGGLTSLAIEPAAPGMAVPVRLTALPRVPASYRASGKMDNFFGVMVERLTPMPGILTYQRDRVIDARSGAAVTGRD
jgi:hypothetical protein